MNQLKQFTSASQELINQSAQVAINNHNPTLQPIHTLFVETENEFCRSFFIRQSN